MRVPAKHLRPAIQAASFAAIAALFYSLQYPVSMPWSNPLLAADPLAGLAGLIFSRGAWIPALLPIAVLVTGTMLAGRAFCGWICPVGFLSDIAGRVRRGSLKVRARFGYLQFGILAAVLLLSVFTLDVLAIADPLVIFQRSMYIVLTGSGVPVVLLLIVAGSMAMSRLWCRAICPLGGLLGLASVISPFGRKLDDSCISCMKCHRRCPMGAISKDNKWDASACTKCLRCEDMCPKGSIGFSPSAPQAPALQPSRRALITGAVAIGALVVSKGAASALTPERALIRPPGSLIEEKFNAACARCESCAKVCAGAVIVPAGLDAGPERWFTPALDFSRGSCQRCGTCGQVCPTGAIISLPEDKIKIGTARIDAAKCVAWKDNTKCLICNEVCPVRAVKGAGRLRPYVVEETCVGCGACHFNCPVKEGAIVISPEGEWRRE
ncbi:4Fe-4S binding protein [Methanocella sp. MCL-LM]|uniref:4Fe-4S binding protein n=1 Tax=Methanocella sp. MCL-LM TaxID=3412035 RepID=UPI003C77BDF3